MMKKFIIVTLLVCLAVTVAANWQMSVGQSVEDSLWYSELVEEDINQLKEDFQELNDYIFEARMKIQKAIELIEDILRSDALYSYCATRKDIEFFLGQVLSISLERKIDSIYETIKETRQDLLYLRGETDKPEIIAVIDKMLADLDQKDNLNLLIEFKLDDAKKAVKSALTYLELVSYWLDERGGYCYCDWGYDDCDYWMQEPLPSDERIREYLQEAQDSLEKALRQFKLLNKSIYNIFIENIKRVLYHGIADIRRLTTEAEEPGKEPGIGPTPLPFANIIKVQQTIIFSMPGQQIRVEVFDLNGRNIAASDFQENQVSWGLQTNTGENVANGVYLYVITFKGSNGGVTRSEVRKLVVLR